MASYDDTDIKLDKNWQLTQATNGDAPIISDTDCLIQDIKIESLTQEGELFYDLEYGWSLLDFMHQDDDDLIRLEIKERVREKLEKRPEVEIESLQVEIQFDDDELRLKVLFNLTDGEEQEIDVALDRVEVEVIESD